MGEACQTCGAVTAFRHDHKPGMTGLDDGPWLPGKAPRGKPPKKTAEELRAIRAKAWATRRRAVQTGDS